MNLIKSNKKNTYTHIIAHESYNQKMLINWNKKWVKLNESSIWILNRVHHSNEDAK